jgi:hypothetical protein
MVDDGSNDGAISIVTRRLHSVKRLDVDTNAGKNRMIRNIPDQLLYRGEVVIYNKSVRLTAL